MLLKTFKRTSLKKIISRSILLIINIYISIVNINLKEKRRKKKF